MGRITHISGAIVVPAQVRRLWFVQGLDWVLRDRGRVAIHTPTFTVADTVADLADGRIAMTAAATSSPKNHPVAHLGAPLLVPTLRGRDLDLIHAQ